MRVQQISIYNAQRSQKRNSKQKNSKVSTYEFNNNAAPISFGQIKADYIKKIFTPVTKSLDEKLAAGMKKMHISHKAAENLTPKVKVGDYTKILIEKINANQKRIDTLSESLDIMVKPRRVKEAEEKLDFYYSWHDSIERAYYENKAEAAKKEERGKYWWGFKWMSSAESKYEAAMEPYWSQHNRYKEIEKELHNLRAIIDDHHSTRQSKEDTLASLKRERNSLIAELTSARTGDFIADAMHQSGGIEERIAGYSDVKEKIKQDFVGPLLASSKDSSVNLPNAVVLYGATGVGKTEMLRGIEEQCKGVANVVHFPMNIELNKFIDKMNELLNQSKLVYKNEKKRTIILFDEAEKYLSMRTKQAERYGSDFEPDDFDILKNCGDKSYDNVQYMKSLLDWISEVPDNKNPEKSAATLFITTNYPHLIDQDLMRRKGKFMPIAVKSASDSNLKAVIQHYFKKYSNLLETLKSYSTFPNFREILNGQIGLTEKSKEVLAQRAESRTISNMNINHELTDWPNWERFAKFTNPSSKKGAYSNVEIKYMIKEANKRYLENPSKPMYEYFFDVKSETKRDITPKRYEKFENIRNIVSDTIEDEGFDEASKSFSSLLKDYTNGLTNEDMSKVVEEKMEKVLNDFSKLEQKKKSGQSLSSGEEQQYDLYKRWVDIWE